MPAASAALELELSSARTTMIAADLSNNAISHWLHRSHPRNQGIEPLWQLQCLANPDDTGSNGRKINNQEIKPLVGSKLDAIRADAPANPAQLWTYFFSMDPEIESLAVFAALSLNGTQMYGEEQALTHGDQLGDKLATHRELGFFLRPAISGTKPRSTASTAHASVKPLSLRG